jgi:hypothetical protein
MITLIDNQFHSNKTWSIPLKHDILVPIEHPEWVDMFDQNGYRLTKLESHYAAANHQSAVNHRHEVSLRQDWFSDGKLLTGAHLNHAYLFERKGYSGEALEQLKEYAKRNNLVNKLINYKGKWGVDFSMDYVDSLGNSMEILHFEYDSYNLNEVQEIKEKVEEKLFTVDWNQAAQFILEKKNEWIDLEFFEQSKWKTDFFNLPQERFKQNAWE